MSAIARRYRLHAPQHGNATQPSVCSVSAVNDASRSVKREPLVSPVELLSACNGSALDQRHVEDDFAARLALVTRLTQHGLNGFGRHVADRNLDGGQGWLANLRLGNVVETDDRELFGNGCPYNRRCSNAA